MCIPFLLSWHGMHGRVHESRSMWLTPPILTESIEISGDYQKQVFPSSLTLRGLHLPTTSHVPEPSKILQFPDVNLHTFIVSYKVDWYSFIDIFWLPPHCLHHPSTIIFYCSSIETCWTLMIVIIIALVLKDIHLCLTLNFVRVGAVDFSVYCCAQWLLGEYTNKQLHISSPSVFPAALKSRTEGSVCFCGLYSTLLMRARKYFFLIVKYRGSRLLYSNLLL